MNKESITGEPFPFDEDFSYLDVFISMKDLMNGLKVRKVTCFFCHREFKIACFDEHLGHCFPMCSECCGSNEIFLKEISNE